MKNLIRGVCRTPTPPKWQITLYYIGMVLTLISCTISEARKQEARNAYAKCMAKPGSQYLPDGKDLLWCKYPNTPEGIRRMCRDAYPIYTRK